MARDLRRRLLIALSLLVLAAAADAQVPVLGGGQGQGRRGRHAGGRHRGAAPAHPGAAKPKTPLPPLEIPGVGPLPGEVGAKPDEPPDKEKDKKKAPAKAGEAPVDPMQAADLVTAAADHAAEQHELDLRRLREHFRVCDLDDNGWLSLREAQVTLALGRDEYRRFDANQDGRLDPAEFEAQSELFLTRLGATEPAPEPAAPAPAAETPAAPQEGAAQDSPVTPGPAADRTAAKQKPQDGKPHSEFATLLVKPAELLQRYDLDQSKGISGPEIEKFFSEFGLVLSSEMVIAQMDANKSGELEARELKTLAWLASQNVPESLRPDPPVATATPDVADDAPAAPLPPHAPTHFTLLDPGRDGFIDESDLRALQSQARLDVRVRAVLSAMDTDGDGRLSEAEFRASMERRAN